MNKWEKSDCRCRPGAKNSKCTICHKPFAMDMGGWAKTTIMVREHSVSSFRGDDVVEFAHPLCIANPELRGGARKSDVAKQGGQDHA